MPNKRGRKSSEDVAMELVGNAVEVIDRPDAPLNLTPEETDEWVATVEAMPADWFSRETWPLLAQWCRHTVTARRVSQMIDHAMAREEIDSAEVKDLLGMQAKETASLKALASSMRLSQQASYTDKAAGTKKNNRPKVKRLWD